MDFDNLVLDIQTTHEWFQAQAARQINVGLTLRNWLFGMYIVEYEQMVKIGRHMVNKWLKI